jgi:glycosyltransferase involved in cell wall biosynthesis
MRATFVFPNSRATVLAGLDTETEPDTTLYGANHLHEHGVEARVHDPVLSRRPLPMPLERIAWHLRELTVPLEIGRTDVVFTPLAATLPLSARARRLPVVVHNYGINLIWRRASAARRRLLGASLRSAARVVCAAEAQRLELIEDVGLPPGNVLTMQLPVDDRFFTPRGNDGETVVTVGKDLSRDYATFAKAVRTIDAPAELAVHARNLEGVDLPPNATWRGLIPSLELRELYARAACVVLPQRPDDYPYGTEAGGSIALLEAMAMAKPVVLTEREMLRDLVDDGVDALVVPAEDPTALRAAIERVLGDPELARSLGAAARARIERAHSTRDFAARLAPVLRSVV